MSKPKTTPTWSDVKAKLTDFDRAGLIGLVQDLYAASKDNQAFLHARFALGGDVLKPYKTVIERWLWPDVFKNQDTSVAKAKKAIADYKKAIGLATLWIEQGRGVAPMRFQDLVDVCVIDPALRDSIDQLLAIKRAVTESEYGKPFPIINAFIDSELTRLEKVQPLATRDTDFAVLNVLLMETVLRFDRVGKGAS